MGRFDLTGVGCDPAWRPLRDCHDELNNRRWVGNGRFRRACLGWESDSLLSAGLMKKRTLLIWRSWG